MRSELPIDISGLEVLPDQGLEDKIGFVARIERVDNTDKGVLVGIQNKTDILNGHSALNLSQEDFEKLLDLYNLQKPSYLIGKPVISVYTRSEGVRLSGFIALNLDRA